MKYDKVSFVRYHEYTQDSVQLNIDGNMFWYDWDYSDMTFLFLTGKQSPSNTQYVLHKRLPLYVNNPKETLDRFFKLLMLA